MFQDAQDCARAMISTWIRSVFQEATLQVLAKRCRLEETSAGEVARLTVTHGDVHACHDLCEKVANAWIQRLHAAGQNQVAGWVQEVMGDGRFWMADDQALPTRSTGTTSRRSTVTQAEIETFERSGEEASDVEEPPVVANTLPTMDANLPLAKLRRLGESHHFEVLPTARPPIQDFIKALDGMGNRGETQWPYEWTVIEEAARENTKRMHTETLRGRPRKVRAKPEIELVPKTLLTTEQAQSQEAEELRATHAVLSGSQVMNALDRKRKASLAADSDAATDKRQKQPVESEPPLSRPPLRHGVHERWTWNSVIEPLSVVERHRLEQAMIHPEELDDDNAPVNALLGGLVDLGGCQFFLQPNESRPDPSEWTDKQRRRYRRASTKERLGPHDLLKEDRTDESGSAKTASKIKRSLDPESNCHFLEIDLGECLLEAKDDSDDSRWYAFSSVEMTVLDEDTDSIAREMQSGGETMLSFSI